MAWQPPRMCELERVKSRGSVVGVSVHLLEDTVLAAGKKGSVGFTHLPSCGIADTLKEIKIEKETGTTNSWAGQFY